MMINVVVAILSLVCAFILVTHMVEAYRDGQPQEPERRAEAEPPAGG
jgi:hypothetical protein